MELNAAGNGNGAGGDSSSRVGGSEPLFRGLADGPMASGIDWSIFRDGEDDTFAWLWRANSTEPTLAPAGAAAAADASSISALPLPAAAFGRGPHSSTLGAPPPYNASESVEFEAKSSLPRASLTSGTNSRQDTALDTRVYDVDSDNSDDNEFGDDDDLMSTSDDQLSTSGHSPSAQLQQEHGEDHQQGRSQQRKQKQLQAGAKGKRQLKRRKATATVNDEAKKHQRRVKNLASVREFRKRKMKQHEENEIRLRRLEAENMDLKMRLKIGKDALVSEQREKQQIKDQMRDMLQRGASEQEVAHFVNMYKVTYSDYGPKRREKLQFHLARIRELLLPTQVTKLSLYSVEQGSEMIARDKDLNDDSTAATDAGMAPISLWGILANELGVSEAQQRQILERRESINRIRDDLNHTLGIVKQLEHVTDEKNTALGVRIDELQHILTPSQATKFIIWVKENPAFMYMLDKLVDSTLMGTDA